MSSWLLVLILAAVALLPTVVAQRTRLGRHMFALGGNPEAALLSGGIGTIPGAIVGALLIQSLDNGMVLMDVSSAKRQIFIGLIMIGAVWSDRLYNKGRTR